MLREMFLRRSVMWALASCAACGPEQPATGFAPTLSIGEPLRVLGAAEGPGLVFGAIADVELLPDGTLLVVDRAAAMILHVSPDGRLVASFGGRGAGPGEFQAPVDVALLPGDEYAVLDADQFRITRVGIEGDQHRYLGDIGTTTQALRFCSIGSQLLLNAVHGAYALQRVDLGGAIIGQHYDLAEVVDADIVPELERELRDQSRLGVLRCLHSGNVLFASEWTPPVFLFGPEGRMLGSADVVPHATLQYRVRENGRAGPELPPEQWVHRAVSVHDLEPGIVLVQYIRYGPGGGGRDDLPTEIRIIRLSDGAQTMFGDTLPILGALESGTAWGWRNLPFPQVVQVPIFFAKN